MPAPQEIPGFYFDAKKNRYFPVKGPIPGSRRKRAENPAEASSSSYIAQSSSSGTHSQTKSVIPRNINQVRGRRAGVYELMESREIQGKILMLKNNRCFFEQEYEKLCISSCSSVWKCDRTELISDAALEHFHMQVQTPEGQLDLRALLMGGNDGSLSLYGLEDIEMYWGPGYNLHQKTLFPVSKKWKSERNVVLDGIWTPRLEPKYFPSSVSSITKVGGRSRGIPDDNRIQDALVTTLGMGDVEGSVYLIKLKESLDFRSDVLDRRRLSKISSHDFTIWAAACDSSGTKAALGTSRGASLLNIETGRLSWLFRTKSDVFCQQFHPLGNVVLCGLRNGNILAVDIRENMAGSYRYFTPSRRDSTNPRRDQKRCAEHKHLPTPICAVMPSAVCSLVTLQSDEQYFIGSSMDGSIVLFDRRVLRKPVQSYEGHVNSHCHLDLGIDQSEAFVMSGGEDRCLRIWSVKSGDLLFSERVDNAILNTICWMPNGGQTKGPWRDCDHGFMKRFEVWMGSMDGLFCLKDVASWV